MNATTTASSTASPFTAKAKFTVCSRFAEATGSVILRSIAQHACYSSRVLASFFGSIFRYLPGPVRRRVVRLGQTRFTVTAGAFVFDNQGRILLLEHEFRADSRWGIPGGFLDKGEQPDAALRRELHEEVSLEVTDVELYFARALKRPHQVELYFACTATNNPTPSSFEIRKAQWFDLNELPGELSNDQRRIIKRALDVREKRSH